GTRMGGDFPKVLSNVKGKSMIRHLLHAVENSKVDSEPTIVVGYKKEMVEEELAQDNKSYHYLTQEHQLGTGHAVNLAKDYLKNSAEHVMVLYGDHPFVSAQTIKNINERHLKSGKKITMATVKLPDFRDWRINFVSFSRVIRNANGEVEKVIEYKDASDKEIKITEVNPCYFCFEAKWLWENLENLKDDNAQKEYYLTDLLKIATEEEVEIESIDIEPVEALGANTRAELETLEKFAV
ncbi:NTP transferase domain-containing protein, partial [Candidatus Nomurabacteria bacterium]|nr:NTP transferase domain-containing protein [Candidatus Nomurabacteria bacterium]